MTTGDSPNRDPFAGSPYDGAFPAWMLGSTRGAKVIHRPTCAYGDRPYRWACQWPNIDDLARAILATKAESHNHACLRCSKDLANAIRRWKNRVANTRVRPLLPEAQEFGWLTVLPTSTVGPRSTA